MILAVTFPSRELMGETVCRMEEFHESQHKEIVGKFFTMETFERLVGLESYQEWDGFNFSLIQFHEWRKAFPERLRTELESKFCALVDVALMDFPDIAYIIMLEKDGAVDVLEHELAHAYYCLSVEYRQQANDLLQVFSKEHFVACLRLQSWLSDFGYNAAIWLDEMQAYLASSTLDEIKESLPADTFDYVTEIQAPFKQLLATSPAITIHYEHFNH